MSHETEDRIVHAVEVARGAVTWRNVVIVGLVVILVFVYCSGRSSKARDLANEEYTANQTIVHDTVRVVNDRLRVDTLRLVKVVKAVSTARAEHDTATSRIADLVASGETLIPASIVLPEIKTCELALRADSLALASWAQSFRDAVTRGDYQTTRADLAENQLKHGRSRFGYKWGLASGIAITAGLVRLLK